MAAIYHTFLNVTVADKVEALIVPQKVYGSAAQFTPNETIQFSHNGQSGIRMVTALDSCNGLDGETVISPIVTMGTKVSLRVNWPGCQPWSESVGVVATQDGRPTIITKARLARVVAKAMKRFYDGGYHRSGSWELNSQWLPNVIPFESLILYELRHVSKGSYQPVILFCPV